MSTKRKPRYGFNLQKERDERSHKDHVYGGLSKPCLTSIPPDERDLYLPQGERQNIGEEKMDCASRSPLNILEAKINWLLMNNKISVENTKWLNDKGYVTDKGFEVSDSFVAINSGTTEEGNSLKAPLDAIRKQGLIPKSMLPQAETIKEHLNPARITKEMSDLGLEFASRFSIRYEKVYEQDYVNLIMQDFLGVAGFAWEYPKDGEYQRTDKDPNHAFMVYKPLYYAFDNYVEQDGDFIKKLARDYNFLDYGYRVYILSEQVPPTQKTCWFENWLSEIIK